MEMNIAALSVDMHLAQTQQDLGVTVLKLAMETTTEQAQDVLEELGSLEPNLGNIIDVRA